MPLASAEFETLAPTLEVRLLGTIDFLRCLEFQRRLVDEAALGDDGRIVLLLAEHPPTVTIGRGGCANHLVALSGILRRANLGVHWVNRGGGCMVHAPGQLAIYPIVPLRWYGLSVGMYLERLQTLLLATMEELSIRAQVCDAQLGLQARSGQFATVGVAVRHWVSYFGAYLNVQPAMGLFRLLESGSPSGGGQSHLRMTSLLAELGRAAKMTAVRTALVRQVGLAFGCQRQIVKMKDET